MDLLTANDAPASYPASWYAARHVLLAPFPPLRGEARADVAVVGGGLTGLSAALHLAEAGASVVLLEAHRVGWGASGRNGGQLGSGQRQDQDWLEAALGRDHARALWELGEEAKALVRALAARHAPEADLRGGIAYVAHKKDLVGAYHAYAEKLRRDYGYAQARPLDAAEAAAALGTEAFHGGMLDEGAAHLDPLAFVLGLARAAVAARVRVHEASRVRAVEPGLVRTAEGVVRAEHVVLGANGYGTELHPGVAARVMPINNFIVVTEPLATPPIRTGIAAASSRFVVDYWRQTRDGRLLFGGGETYGYRFPANIAGLVRRPLAKVYPALAGARIDHAWGGTLAITMNRMPAFQRLAGGIWSAAGYSGHGLGMATLAGRLVAEAIGGDGRRFDVVASIPQPRFPGGVALRWPLLVMAMSWYAMRDRL